MNLVFDFGAVLVRWQPVLLVKQHLPHLAPTAEAAAALAHRVFAHEYWLAFDRGLSPAEEVVARTASRLETGLEGVERMVAAIGEHLAPIEDTLDVLAQLRERRAAGEDLRLYYLSNMPAPYARLLEREHEFVRWFDGGVFSGDVGLAKPQREIFELLAQRHALVPARTVFIDDMPYNVAAAEALGWRGIRFQSAAQLREQLAALPGVHP
jgi:putative hydrolase of the HAD superfamily